MNDLNLITAKQLAGILNIPTSWIYQRTRYGEDSIPHYRIGKYVRFDPEEVKMFFKSVKNNVL